MLQFHEDSTVRKLAPLPRSVFQKLVLALVPPHSLLLAQSFL